jgi:multiple sugar transport system substrate-binding protein
VSRKTRRPRFITLVVALAVALGVAACGGGNGSGDASGEIRFLVFGEPEELRAYRDVVRAFSDREPDVRVQLITASDREDLLARLSTSFAGGSPHDVFLLNYRFYGQFAARGALEPLGDRLAESEVFRENDFYAEPLEAFRWDGELTCLPQNVSSLVVYYNRELFRRYRVPEPRAGWKWDDMVGKALRLTRDLNGDGDIDLHGLGIEPSIIRVAPFVWSNAGEIVDDQNDPTRFTLDTPEALEAMQKLFDLRQTHFVVPSEEEVEAEDDETRFQNGRLAMVLSSRRSTPTFRTITDFEWDVAPLPVHRDPAGILHSDAYCMARESDSKDAAWRFVEFALGPEGQRIAARTGRTVPSLRAVATSPAFLDPSKPPRSSRVFLDTIPVIRRVPSISTWPEIEDAAEQILETGLYQGVSAEEIARRLDERTRPMFERAER